MKKVLLLVLAISLVLGVTTVIMAGMTAPGVYDTPHDVRIIAGEEGLEPCAMCHTPHSGTGDNPLWNRSQPAQSYTPYTNITFDMQDTTAWTDPGYPSNLCLVCHNGVYSSLVNYPGPGSHSGEEYDYEMNPTFWAMLGTDLSNDHPIGFDYVPSKDNEQDNNGFPEPNTCITGGGTAANRMWIPSTSTGRARAYPLYSDATNPTDKIRFQCATCHAVHDTINYPGKQLIGGKSVGTQVFFLRNTNYESRLCADCHPNRWRGSF